MPILGICLGMHLLFDYSEEGVMNGLGWIPGIVKRFQFNECDHSKMKIPHMGWNHIQPLNQHILFSGLDDLSRFYFVHSYHVQCNSPEHSTATSVYGYPFTCAVQKGNIFGVQFHPEKSHKYGMKLFENFLEYVC